MASVSATAKKMAWLEAMLDTSIIAYESHRNALENIYAQLAQWQQPPSTGCIHISPAEVNELLRDINDVLDQCALQLQPFQAEGHDPAEVGSHPLAAQRPPSAYSPPSSSSKAGRSAAQRTPVKDLEGSQVSSHRGVTAESSLRSPVQDNSSNNNNNNNNAASQPPPPQQQQQRVPPASHTPSVRSRVSEPSRNNPVDGPRAPKTADSHEASARTASDAPSRPTNRSATNPPPPQQQQQQQRQQDHARVPRTPSQTPSQVSSVPPSVPSVKGLKAAAAAAAAVTAPPAESIPDTHSVHSDHSSHHSRPPASAEENDRDDDDQQSVDPPTSASLRSSVAPDGSRRGDAPANPPAERRATAAAPNTREGPAADTASTRSGTTQRSQQPQQQPEKAPAVPSSASSAVVAVEPAESGSVRHRPQMQACPHHHRRVAAALALSPWPILNSGRDDAAAVGGALPPSAATRAAAAHDELPAQQYSAYKERGRPLTSSPERQAAAAALEQRAREEEAARENAVYLAPDDNVADRAAARVRGARQPAPTGNPPQQQQQQPEMRQEASSRTLLASLNGSHRSHNPTPSSQQPPQQQQPRANGVHGPSVRSGPPSTAPSSVAGPNRHHQGPPQPQQQQSHDDPPNDKSSFDSKSRGVKSANGDDNESDSRRQPHSHHRRRPEAQEEEDDASQHHMDPHHHDAHYSRSAGDHQSAHHDDEESLEDIPRRRGSSVAAESHSEPTSSFASSRVDEVHVAMSQHTPSEQSRLSQPPRQHRTPQHQQQFGSRTPSQLESRGRSASARDGGSVPPQDSITSIPQNHHHHQQQQQQQQPKTVASSSRASSAVGPRSGSANPPPLPQQPSSQQGHHGRSGSSSASVRNGASSASSAQPSVRRQLDTNLGNAPAAATHAAPPPMDASQVGSVGLVQTPSATPQRDSTRDASAASQQQQLPQQQQPSLSQPPPQPQQQQMVPGEHRPLRTAVPRRTTPRAYDSTQSEDAIFHLRRNSPGRPPVRADSPNALRYMDREDSQLRQRRDEELAEVQADPRVLRAQLAAGVNGPQGPLQITDGAPARGPTGGGSGNQVLTVVPERSSAVAKPEKMTAVEEQLTAERAALIMQLEKMQMEVTIATMRNKEWGNERRYSQVNTRMSRVMADLDRVEKELRTVRNFDRQTRSDSATKSR